MSNMESDGNGWQGRDLYQVYPLTFNEERDDPGDYRGVGSINGITEKLDHISTVANALWISPFYPSPLRDGGYDVEGYTDVDPRFGTLQDLEQLVVEAHERDMKVMIDLVPNHTSDQHPWFQASRDPSHPDHEQYRDFYMWRDPAPDGGPPNNWGSVFSIPQRKKWEAGELELEYTDEGEPYIPPLSAWEFDERRGQYYLHDFAFEQPNLNWHNPDLREAMKDVLRFWIDRGVDGFRVDVVDHIGKDPEFNDDTFTPDLTLVNPYDQFSRDRSIRYWPELERNILELTGVLREYGDRDLRLILEAHADQELLHRIDRIDPDYAATFYFTRMKAAWNAQTHKSLLDYYHAHLPEGMVANQVNGNHDFTRAASRLGRRAARVAAAINYTLPGMNTIYNGEEGGFTDVDVPVARRRDDLGYRDMCRTPPLWNGSPNAGFSPVPEEELWLPVDPDFESKHFELQADDPRSYLNLFRSLHQVRSGSPILRLGQYAPLQTDNPNVVSYARRHRGRQMIIASNFSPEPAGIRIASPQQILGRVVLTTDDILAHPYVDLETGLRLNGDETLILEAAA